MSSTPSTAHRRDFCRALYLQPSDDKSNFLVIRGHLRPLNHCPKWEIRQVCPIWGNFFIEAKPDPFSQEIRSRAWEGFFFETTETKETTAKQSIIRMIINFSVVPVVPVVSKFSKEIKEIREFREFSEISDINY